MNKKTSKMKKLYEVEYVENLKRSFDKLFGERYDDNNEDLDLTEDECRDIMNPNPSELVKMRVKKVKKKIDEHYYWKSQQWDEEGIKWFIEMRNEELEEMMEESKRRDERKGNK